VGAGKTTKLDLSGVPKLPPSHLRTTRDYLDQGARDFKTPRKRIKTKAEKEPEKPPPVVV
jgi:hypothetical protein